MKKMVLMVLSLICGLSVQVYAQFESIKLTSDNQELIRRAVENGIVLMRQSYQLEDTTTGKRYTIDNRPEFGSATAVAVRTKHGFIVPKSVLSPWEDDNNYNKYKGSAYVPVLTGTSLLRPGSESWSDTLQFVPDQVLLLPDSRWCEAVDTTYFGNGFTVGKSEDHEGWIVWLVKDPDTMDMSLVVYRLELPEVADEKDVFSIKKVNTKMEVLGGIFLTPAFDSIGKVDFELCGVVFGKGDKWSMMLLGDHNSGTAADVLEEISLTPVE
ncbi:MAG TPA: hypothetical protein IAC03_05670 [Candidatus Coprenecus pullistercoris]|nr:hypothetical protein [Candidatus Coprenecus pullistercoris]